MLDLDRLDLDELCSALEDNSPEHTWWLAPRTGELELRSESGDAFDEGDPEEQGWIHVDPIGSHEAYGDMEAFAERVSDPRARNLLSRAIGGRGAFRRFKDTLFEFPDLRETWFRFHDARMRRRAIEWLLDRELISHDDAERAVAHHPEPELGDAIDPHAIARAVAADLRELYGSRPSTSSCSAPRHEATPTRSRTSISWSFWTRLNPAAGSSSGWTRSCGAIRWRMTLS